MALAASCSGTDFGQSEEVLPQAGADTGGAAQSSGGADVAAGDGTGGSSVVGPGGAPGSAGEPNLPDRCDADAAPICASKSAVAVCEQGLWVSQACQAGANDCAPALCSDGKCVQSALTPVDPKGDCKHWACAMGEATSEVDLNDVPAAMGVCDVASCSDAGPKFTDDNAKCAANMKCSSGACVCRGCPNGKLQNALADTCLMPMGMTATANHSTMVSTAAGAIDGTLEKTWNAGQTSGVLTLTPSNPQPMLALVIYVTGSADPNSVGARTISVNAKVEDADGGMALSRNGSWDFGMLPTGPIRLDLGRVVKASKITLTFSSPSSWIAVNEALFVICANP